MTDLDPAGFVGNELAARGALVDAGLAILPPDVAARLAIADELALDAATCGLGTPLLDRLIADVRANVPVAQIAWALEPPRLAQAEVLAGRVVVRNGVADVIGVAHASAVYVAGVFGWTAEADDRYEGAATVVVHAASAGEPDASAASALLDVVAGVDVRVRDESNGAAITPVALRALSRRGALAIGPRLDELAAAVARRRDREHARIDEYFASLIGEAKRPRRNVGTDAIEARVAALRAEHGAKRRDLAARYALRIRLEPIGFAMIAVRVAEVRVRLRRRKLEREVAWVVPPLARAPDALACAACPGVTRAPLLCDDALHVLCEACAPEATGRPRCPVCRR